jgi:predicted RNase H-like nuclease (RuvC/YqgF family)
MNQPPTPQPKDQHENSLFATWKKIAEFVADVMHLKRSVATLTEQHKKLDAEIARLQRQVDEQGGQLKVLIEFVHTSLRNDIETRAERAAVSLIERLIALRDEGPQEDER